MAAQERAEEHGSQRQEARQSLKRRGILAAGGAVVAGIMAKQTSQPVAAATLTTSTNSVTGYTALVATAPWDPASHYIFAATPSESNPPTIGVIGVAAQAAGPGADGVRGTGAGAYSGVTGFGGPTDGNGIYGQGGGSTGTGVVGLAAGAANPGPGGAHGVFGNAITGEGVYGLSTNGIGVRGYSTNSYGVSGYSNTTHAIYGSLANSVSGTAAVYGSGFGDGTFGIIGNGLFGRGVGVQGQSPDAGGTGIKGVSTNGFPIIGQATGGSNNAAGVLGVGTKGPGVQGQSPNGHGLVGTTDAPNGHAGLIGNATHTGGIGLMGIAPNYGTGTVGHAGEFYGNVKIYGGGLVAPVVQASIKHQGDGSYRALHSLATPEGWIEDFGTGTLAADKADITLDHDFTALVDPNTLHVFLTPEGPLHLHVSQKSASGFSVVAMPWATAAGGPKLAVGGGSFSYRVVGKRKDITSERLAKLAAPTAPPRPSALTIPETPMVTAPTKRP